MSTNLADLFRRYAIPPSPLHAAAQEAARQAGWTPPWDREKQQNQKKVAGKKSGASRAALGQIRRSIVSVARMRVKSKYAPYSNASIDALEKEYRVLLGNGRGEDCASLVKDKYDPSWLVPLMLEACSEADQQKLKTVSRETLVRDLKRLLKTQRESAVRSR